MKEKMFGSYTKTLWDRYTTQMFYDHCRAEEAEESTMNIKEKIAVMQHYADGGTVQKRMAGAQIWTDCDCSTPRWNWAEFEYRIEPKEPRRFYVVDLGGSLGYSRALAEQTAATFNGKVVEAVEVLP